METIFTHEGEELVAVEVRLSKRNLLALLSKVDDASSARTIYKGCTRVVVEPDEVHYAGREPGRMTQEVEEFIKAHS